MIPSLPDLTATPASPTSAIAPAEIIGNATFPSLLGGFQQGDPAPLPSAGLETGTASKVGERTAATTGLVRSSLAQSGKALPQGGMLLPSDLQDARATRPPQGERASEPANANLVSASVEADELVETGLPGSSLNRVRTSDEGDVHPASEQTLTVRQALRGEKPIELPEAALPVTGFANAEQTTAGPSEMPQAGEDHLAAGNDPRVAWSGPAVEAATQDTAETNRPASSSIAMTGADDGRASATQEPLVAVVTKPNNAKALDVSVETFAPVAGAGKATPSKQLPSTNAPPDPVRPIAPQGEQGPVAFQKAPTSIGAGQPRSEPKVQTAAGPNVNLATAEKDAAALEPNAVPQPQPQSQPKPKMAEAIENRPIILAGQAAETAVRQGQVAMVDTPSAKAAQRSELRATTEQPASQSVTPASFTNKQSQSPGAILGDAQSTLDAPRATAPSGLGTPIAGAQIAQNQVDASASQQPATQPQSALVSAAPIAASQPANGTHASDPNAAFRHSPQLESTIDQLTQTRSDAQANRPELTVRHQEFGAITMRLDAGGGDLRATLYARDPGFVPAIHSALAERSVAATSETAGSGSQRGSEQSGSQTGSQSNWQSGSHGSAQGQGWNSGAQYGSSTGAGQGTSQPYTGQTENRDKETASDQAKQQGERGGFSGDGERFA